MTSSIPSSTPTASLVPFQPTHPCHNCDQWGHVWFRCPQKNTCLKCPTGTPTHSYWDHAKCLHRKNFSKPNNDAKPRTKANAAVSDHVSAIAAKDLEIQQLRARLEVKDNNKKIFLDSGANHCIIADLNHLDPYTSPSFGRSEEYSGVETASQEVLAVEGQGQIMGVPGVICSGAGNSLISLGQVLDVHNANCLVTSSEAIVFAKCPRSDVLVNDLNDSITSTKTGLIVASRNVDNLYEITNTQILSVISPELDPVLESTGVATVPIGDITANSVSESAEPRPSESTVWRPTEAVMEQHRVACAAFYQCTAELPRLRDLVRFFHDAWDHPSRELMCKIVDNKMLTGLPDELTSKVIRKYFP